SLGAAPGALAWVASSALTSTETNYEGEASASTRWAILANGLDRRRDDVKTRTTAFDVLVHPDTFWARHWSLVGARTDQTEPNLRPPRSLASWASSSLALLLVVVAVWGAGSLARRRWSGHETAESRLALAVIASAIALPVPLRILSPDPHHLALWTPVVAMALGLSLAAAGLQRRWLPTILFALALMVPLRVQTLREIDEQTASAAGRLATAGGQARLAATLKGRGFLAPAMLDYTVMSLMEAWSGGEVRPWLYGRAAVSRRRGCLGGAHPEFLPRILEAHIGGHVVIVAGMKEEEGGRPDSYRSSEQMARAALAARVQVRRVQVVADERGRWMADVWAVEPGPESKDTTPSRVSPPGDASLR
ncbi:MAG: hypothetical protein KDA24_03425, partial [Deltaproteobacteria bacterium]|nr:hypothetical protein [Deltaproteobacteria bacterium]